MNKLQDDWIEPELPPEPWVYMLCPKCRTQSVLYDPRVSFEQQPLRCLKCLHEMTLDEYHEMGGL